MELDKEKVFEKLFEDPYNQVCCDCGKDMNYESFRPGITTMGFRTHRAFGMQISFVRSIMMDSWTAKQFSMMQNGGNSKFRSFMSSYDLDNELATTKYKTKAAEYYRKNLKAIAENDTFAEPLPALDVGREMLPGYTKPFPPTKPEETEEEKKETTALGYISKGFFSIVDSAKEIGQKAKVKLEGAKLGEKFSHAKTTVAETATTAGSYVYDKTKAAAQAVKQKSTELVESESMQNLKNNTKSGVSKAGAAIAGAFTSLWSMATGKSEEKKEQEEAAVNDTEGKITNI